jgi:ribose-phosphate pyrophosphokinase
MQQMNSDDLLVFAGSTSRRLAAKVVDYLGIPLGRSETLTFSDGNTFVKVLENVRGRDCFILQSTVFPANDSFMELAFYVDALKRASAKSVTVVMPYFSYAKGDKKDEPRVSLRGRVCADILAVAGTDRLITVDLHAAQIQGFFTVPVDNLYALPILVNAVREQNLKDLVVVAPDAGFAKGAKRFAAQLDAPVAIADKFRRDHSERAEITGILGDVAGRTALIVDDFAISCHTLSETAKELVRGGAVKVYAAVTHPVFAGDAMDVLGSGPLEKLIVTDSVETQPVVFSSKVEVVSIAPLLGEAIKRIHASESISAMFDGV